MHLWRATVLKKTFLFVVCLFWIANAQAQNFPELNFSIPETYEFEIIKTHQLQSGHTATELTSKSKFVDGKNILRIGHIDMNAISLSSEEFFNSYKSDYSRQGLRSMIQEIDGRKYIIAGDVLNINELRGTDNYIMFATTFHNGDAYSIVVMSTVKDQADWILRIAEEIELY